MSTLPPDSSRDWKQFFSDSRKKWTYDAFEKWCSSEGTGRDASQLRDYYVKSLEYLANKSVDTNTQKRAQAALDKYRIHRQKLRKVEPRSNSHTLQINDGVNYIGNVVFGSGNSVEPSSNRSKRSIDESGCVDSEIHHPLAKRVSTTPSSSIPCSTTPGMGTSTPESQLAARFSCSSSGLGDDRGECSRRVEHEFVCSGRTLSLVVEPDVCAGVSIPITAAGKLAAIINVDEPPFDLTADEKLELKSCKAQPVFGQGFRQASAQFQKEGLTREQLIDLVESPSRIEGCSYRRNLHAEAAYVHNAAGAILSMMESLENLPWVGRKDLQEGWFAVNVWGPLIDRCFHTADNCYIGRTELKAQCDHSLNLRFDGIVCGMAGHLIGDFGAIEVAKTGENIDAQKEEMDQNKLVSIMRLMLSGLLKRVDYNMEVGQRLTVVGLQHVGYCIRVFQMRALSRYVFALHVGRKRYVPTKVEEFPRVVDIMATIICCKTIVQDTMKEIESYGREKAPPADEDFYESFQL